jgi:hypothetical protein
MHQSFFDDDSTYVSFSEIRMAIGRQPANAIRLELESLVDDGLADQRTERRFRPTSFASAAAATLGAGTTTPTYWEPVDGYRLSKKGISKVEEFDDDYFNKVQSSFSLSSSDSIAPSKNNEEESDWEPLPIDRADPDFQAAVESSEKALDAIEQNNGYAATHPDERNGLVKTIRGTLDALKSGTPSRAAVIEGLLKPLKFFVKRFSESSMSELAKLAVAAIMKWLF